MTKRHYTRAELCAKLREIGFPISMAKLNKLCAPSENKGPPVASWWGPRPLYDLDHGIAWAEGLLRSKRSALASAPVEAACARNKT